MMPASKSDQLWRPVLLASGANSAGQWWWRPVVLPSDAVQFAGRLGKSIAQRAHSCTHMLECTASSSNLIYLLQKQRLRALCGSGKVFPFSGVPEQHSGRDSKFGHFLYRNDDFEHFSALGRFSGSQNSGMASKFEHFFLQKQRFRTLLGFGRVFPFSGVPEQHFGRDSKFDYFLLQKRRFGTLFGSGRVLLFSGIPERHSGRDSQFDYFLFFCMAAWVILFCVLILAVFGI